MWDLSPGSESREETEESKVIEDENRVMKESIKDVSKGGECKNGPEEVSGLRRHMEANHMQDRTCFPPSRGFPPGGSFSLKLLEADICPEAGLSAGGCLAWR